MKKHDCNYCRNYGKCCGGCLLYYQQQGVHQIMFKERKNPLVWYKITWTCPKCGFTRKWEHWTRNPGNENCPNDGEVMNRKSHKLKTFTRNLPESHLLLEEWIKVRDGVKKDKEGEN